VEESTVDKLEAYLKVLEERYKYYYEVERDKEISGKEYAAVKAEKRFLDKDEVEKFSKYLKSLINELFTPSVDIMSTMINGVLVSASGFSEEAVSFAKKFKFSKSFLLGIKGWCDIDIF
jgi:hypothetical protein